MPEDSAGGQTPPASDKPPGQPGGQTPPGATTSGQTPLDPQTDDPSIKLSEARRLRKEAEDNAKIIKDLNNRLKQYDDLSKTDKQKRNDRLAELEAQSSTFEQEKQQWRVERAVLRAAPEAGIPPELALRLIDQADVKTNAKGEPTNVPELLAEAIKTFKLQPLQQNGQPATPASRPSPGATNPSRSQSNGHGELSWEYITNLTLTPQGRDEFNARSEEIHRWQIDPRNRIKPYG